MAGWFRKTIEKLAAEELFDFLEEYARKDKEFENAFDVRFGEANYGDEIKKMKRAVDRVFDGRSDDPPRHYSGWGDRSMYVNTGPVLDEIRQRAAQGHIRLAFDEAELLYRKLLENFEWQAECEVECEADSCVEIMSQIAAAAASEDDQQHIFARCLDLSDLEDGKNYGACYEDRLLGIAAKFVTPENRAELEQRIEEFSASSWRGDVLVEIGLDIIRRLDGEIAAKAFIARNLDVPKIREIAFDEAMSRKDFSEAKRLCLDALETAERHWGISPWLYRLYAVYEGTADAVHLADTAKKILLAGDLDYYGRLKSLLLEKKTWHAEYPALLRECGEKLPYEKYMDILSLEGEHTRLIQLLRVHPDQIYRYGKSLAKEHPSETRGIFVEAISKEAESAHTRGMYQRVGLNIAFFAKAGFAEAATEMRSALREKYRRKPAFVDELKKTEFAGDAATA